ncbi:MAG: YegS/Rv2252/BmrU family lipid kinase [Lachnospiraceae bacterium]|nr:YegS/Rv2252/BmrU family lipid kinase [Lachnospiraceae bacterium]
MMNLFFVFNPKAGKEKIKSKLGDIIELFSMEGNKITVAATTKRGDATEMVKNLPDEYDRVICAGGDGTLDEVVMGMKLRKNKLPIGYIPAGSTNDFASSVGIPSRINDAAKVAIGDKLIKCDVGVFNDKSFIYVAAFGAFTEVSYETPQELKNRLGHAAYVIMALKHLIEIKSYKMRIETEHMTIEDEFIYGMITNSDSIGGIKNITGKNINLCDGLFEVTLIRKPKLATDLNSVMVALMDRDYNSKDLYYFKADKLKITCEEEVPWTLDGEFGGNEKEVIIENIQEALELAVK